MNSNLANHSKKGIQNVLRISVCMIVLLSASIEEAIAQSNSAKSSNLTRIAAHHIKKNVVAHKSRTKARRTMVASSSQTTRIEPCMIVESRVESKPGVYEFIFSSGVMTVTDLTTADAVRK